MDDIAKNYGRKTKLDEAMHIINTVENGGFDPYFWISQTAPYAYWFQKTTGERLYSESDIQEFLQELSRPTPYAPDRLSAEGGRSAWAKFVEFSKKLLARIGGR